MSTNSPKGTSSRLILVAEDSLTQAFALKLLLEKDKYTVQVLEDGRSALDFVRSHHPDLVISDIDMPELNGYELCTAIKADPRTSSTPVMLLTTLSDAENIIQGLQSKADFYLTKPYDPSFLLERVRAIVNHPNSMVSTDADGGFEVRLDGRTHVIHAEPQQMLNLLLSTYENAIQQYRVLVRTQIELNSRNQQLREQGNRLVASETNFRSLLENMADGMVVVDDKGIVKFLNHSAQRLLGETFESMSKHGFAFPVRPGETREVELLRPTGQLILELRAFQTSWEGVPACLASMRDITERRLQERKIREQQLELQEANAKLQSLATLDGLTSLKNHRSFKEDLAVAFRSSVESQSALSLVLMDVDRFKSFNDSFGHPAGDEVLKQVAAILVENCRTSDVVARYGGEEFVVLLPESDRSQAMATAERIRRAIESAPWKLRNVTASFGVATRSHVMSDPADLVSEADQALYHSKQTGRNRVTNSLMIQRARMLS